MTWIAGSHQTAHNAGVTARTTIPEGRAGRYPFSSGPPWPVAFLVIEKEGRGGTTLHDSCPLACIVAVQFIGIDVCDEDDGAASKT
jgi:hypothetical protein